MRGRPCQEVAYNIPLMKLEVIRLLFGARSAIPIFIASFLQRFGISLTLLDT